MLTKEIYEKIAYINGIGRNRFDYWNDKAVHPILSDILSSMPIDEQMDFLDNKVIPLTKVCGSWTDWVTTIKKYRPNITQIKNDEKKSLSLKEAESHGKAQATFLFDDTCDVLRFLLSGIGIHSDDIEQFCYNLKINVFEYLLELFYGIKEDCLFSSLHYNQSHLYENVLKELLGCSCYELKDNGEPYLIDKYAGNRNSTLSGGADATLREDILPYAVELAFKYHYESYNWLTRQSFVTLLYYKIKYFSDSFGFDDEWLDTEGIKI